MKETIVIDLDGVIAYGTEEEVYSDKAKWAFEKCTVMEGAKEGLEKLAEKYKLILSTARWEVDIPETNKWLEENDLKKYFIEIRINKKPSAIAYIDDRAIRYSDWKSLLETMEVAFPRPSTKIKESLLGQIEREQEIRDTIQPTLIKATKEDVLNESIMKQLFRVLWEKETIEMLGSIVDDFNDFRVGWFYDRILWDKEKFFYVVLEGTIVGYFHLWEYKEKNYIAYAMNKDYRGKGIASTGVKLLFEKAEELGIKELRANVRDDNDKSISFLIRNGFGVYGIDKEVYENKADRVKFRRGIGNGDIAIR